MYTYIAYLIEIGKFCSKNLVHKGVNFEAQNALKRAALISENFRGYTSVPPLKGGSGGERRMGGEGGGKGGEPPIHIPGYATASYRRLLRIVSK